MKITILGTLLGLALLPLAQPWAKAAGVPVSAAKAAELSLHRLDNLVSFDLVDRSFLDHFSGLEIETLNPTTNSQPKFKATLLQIVPEQGERSLIQMSLDAQGKVLESLPHLAQVSIKSVAWPDADPVTLAESSLHYVIDETANHPELLPFYNSLVSLELTPELDAAGKPMAAWSVLKNSENNSLLKVRVLLNGDFDQAKVE